MTPTEKEQAAKMFGLTVEQVDELEACARDRYGKGMPAYLRVRDKNGNLIPLKPTRIHLKFEKYRRRIALALKPRQVYFTTHKVGDAYLTCVETNGHKALFVNLDNRVTEEVFDRAHVFNEHFTLKRLLPKPKRETTRKLSWMNGSSFDAITVKNDDSEEQARTLGRSCTQQEVHGTECAYWRHYKAFTSGAFDSVPKNGKITLETTGNGAQGGFYEDFMEVMEQGSKIAPGVWGLGEKSAHFFAWWEHPEYSMGEDPLPEFESQMTAIHTKKLHDSEMEHLAEMAKDPELSEAFKLTAVNWRRWMLFNQKNFLRDPDGAITNMDREYPGTVRHAFASTGSAFLSLSLTDTRRDEWKKYNAERRLPLYARMGNEAGEWRPWPGGDDVMFWAPPCDPEKEQWNDRYCTGGDVAGGNANSDFDCIVVKDRVLNMYVAIAHGRFGPAKHAELQMALGYYYHRARLGWETNNHGVNVTIKLWESQYPNLYRWDENLPDWKGFGYPTNEKSRDFAIRLMKHAYEDRTRPLLLAYDEFYREAANFGPPAGKPNGKIEGQNGIHDDIMMAVAICEANDASMPPPSRVEFVQRHEPGTIGYFREMAMGGGRGGLGNVI